MLRTVDAKRAEEIILSANPKRQWYYIVDPKINLEFGCDDCYITYRLERVPNLERMLINIGYLTNLMKERKFEKRAL